MISRFGIFVVITAFMVFAAEGLGIESPLGTPLGSPIGDPAVPQTSLTPGASELIPSDQSGYGSAGNPVSVGNPFDESKFAPPSGIIPYRSAVDSVTWGFGPVAGSDSLNSFIRSSQGAAFTDTEELRFGAPYFFPSRSVISLQGGEDFGFLPPNFRIEPPKVLLPGGIADPAQQQPIYNSQYFYNQQRPLSRSMQELDDIISREIELQKLTSEEEAALGKELTELEQLEEYLAQQFKETPEDEKKLPDEDEIEKPEKPVEPPKLTSEEDADEEPEEEPEDFAEQIRRQQARDEEENADLYDILETDETAQEQADKSDSEFKVGEQVEIPPVDPEEAAKIRGPHKTFKAWAEAKFAEYIKAAEEFLKQGKYYRAADAYTLASVYQPENPLAYGGKALALFAAGEYMSSSYFLERAITLSPEYVNRKYDLAAMLVDRDMIENNIIEMATWQQQGKSSELAFLMAYIFYQNNNLPSAKVAISLVSGELSSSPAVSALTNVIAQAAIRAR
ncbi:MAG: hypothetical protein ACYTFK_05320 [Planctomycetota bacterium]|jgi:hypothetical protein